MKPALILPKPEAETTVFKPASWLGKIDYIHHLSLFDNLVVSVLAEKNGGKSTFLTLLNSQQHPQIRSLLVKLALPFDRNDLISPLIEAFDLKNTDEMHILVGEINERKIHVLLVIDDAQFLSEALFEEILSAIKQQGRFGYFHLCLASDYSFVPVINRRTNYFAQFIESMELGGLNENETKTYISHKIKTKVRAELELSDQTFNKIYKKTGGDIAQINNNLVYYFSEAEIKKKKKMNLLQKAGFAASFAIALLAGIYELHQPSSKLKASLPDEPDSKITALTSELPNWQEKAMIEKTATVFNQALNESILPKIPKFKEEILASSVPAFKGFEPHSYIASIKLNKKRPYLYTIQLLAGREQNLKQFLKQQHLENKTRIYQMKKNNSFWYVLTLGEYQTMGEAKNEIKKFSHQIVKLKPWIRPIGGLKIHS